MFHQDRGVRMCYYKRIRDELGTINYNPISESIPNPKIDLVEIFANAKKKEKKRETKTRKKKKIKINDDKKSKINKLLELAELPSKDSEQEKINEEEKKEEEIEKEEECKIEGEIKNIDFDMVNVKETEIEDNNDDNDDKDDKDDKDDNEDNEDNDDKDDKDDNYDNDDKDEETETQSGGQINPFKKRIYVTNLKVDKDKEMFQM